jgi:hypothetical protein
MTCFRKKLIKFHDVFSKKKIEFHDVFKKSNFMTYFRKNNQIA